MSQHFDVPNPLYRTALAVTLALVKEEKQYIDEVAIPPANPATLRFGDDNVLHLVTSHDEQVYVFQFDEYGNTLRLFSWRPGTDCFEGRSLVEPPNEQTEFVAMTTALGLAMLLTLLNCPKLVVTEPGGTRQQRRAIARQYSIPAQAWHRVRWKTAVGPARSASSNSTGEFGKPLHYRRGHIRAAQAHYERAFQTTLTETGWAQWINGMWVGDPAFGVKTSIHPPVLDEQGVKAFISRQAKP